MVCLVGTGLSVLRRSQGVPAGRRQLLHPRRARSPRKDPRPSRCTRTRSRRKQALHANPGRGHDLHHDRQQSSSCPSNQGLVLAFLKDPRRAAADSSRGRPVDGRDQLRSVPGTDGLSCSPIPCCRSAPAPRPISRGSSPTRSPASIPTRSTPSAEKLMAELFAVSRVSVRQLRPVQPHAEPEGRTSCATRPRSTAFRRRASSICCTTPIRRTTST